MLLVVTLLAGGCPLQAIVTAFGFDERNVKDWQDKAGAHCERVHAALVTEQTMDLGQVQADEVRVKLQRRLVVWMAMAICVPSRLWLGGVAAVHRQLAAQIKACARFGPLLLVTDGPQKLCRRLAADLSDAGCGRRAGPTSPAGLA